MDWNLVGIIVAMALLLVFATVVFLRTDGFGILASRRRRKPSAGDLVASQEQALRPDSEDPPPLDIYLNGMLLQPGGDYTATNPEDPTLVFETPVRRGDVIQFHTQRSRRSLTVREDMPAGASVHLRDAPTEGLRRALARTAPHRPVPPDGWVEVKPPDNTLRNGDIFEYEGQLWWIQDIHQDFNPAGHFTFVKLEPAERSEDVGKPRTRYERMLDDVLEVPGVDPPGDEET